MTKEYRSHKIVTAAAILSITSIAAIKATEAGEGVPAIAAQPAKFSYELDDGEILVLPIKDPMLARYQPVVGDYVVTYPLKEGEEKPYRSFSPKAAFEDGYTEVGAEPTPVPASDDPTAADVRNPNVDPQERTIQSFEQIAASLGRIADTQDQMLQQARS